MVGEIIAGILKNLLIILFGVAIITAVAKAARSGSARDTASISYVLWGEVLFYAVGIGFIYTGLMHAYAQNIVAPSIGWQPSPFEYELGWMEIPLGVVAMLSLWRGYEFRLAATIVFSVFVLAAAVQHIQQILCCQNYAPGNAGVFIWIGDIVLPIVLLLAAALSRRKLPLGDFQR